MAQFEQRENSGALFKNSKKTESKHPDYQGDCMVNGVKMRISAWLKESNGTKFMSLAFSEPYVKDGESVNTQRQTSTPNVKDEDLDQDIPW